MNKNIWVYIGCCMLMFSCIQTGCNIINPAEEIPTYIRVDSFHFIANPNMGTASQKITAVDVVLDNKTIGTYDLPAMVPILLNKKGRIALTPFVTYSGLRDVQVPYPFFKTYTDTLEPNPGKTVSFLPETAYTDDLSLLVEDFESGNSFITISGPDSVKRVQNANEVFEGLHSGKIKVTSGYTSEIALSTPFSGPVETYLELNYKCTVPFIIMMQAIEGNQIALQPLYGFKPINEWNKVYVGLQDYIIQNPNKQYVIVIQAAPENDQGGYILLDNLKVISRK